MTRYSRFTQGIGIAAPALAATLLGACASASRPLDPPRPLAAQTLVLDGLTGEHLWVDDRSPRAHALTASHPGRPLRQRSPSPEALVLGNVSIPLNLGATRPPMPAIPTASAPEEPSL